MIRLRDLLRLNEQEQTTSIKTTEQFVAAMPKSQDAAALNTTVSKSNPSSKIALFKMASDISATSAKEEFIKQFDEVVKNNQKNKNNIRVRAAVGTLSAETTSPGTNIELDLPLGDFFKEDSAEITDTQAMENQIISAIAQLYEVNPPGTTIGLASYRLIATTSKVPSTAYLNKGGNDQLAKDRAAAIKQVVNTALPKTEIIGTLNDVTPEQEELGERGPDYDREKYGLDKRKADQNVRAEYERIYGPHRQTKIVLIVEISTEPTYERKKVNNYEWQFVVRTGTTPPKPMFPTRLKTGKGQFKPRQGKFIPCPKF
jgi:hypothetical protein